MGKGRDISSNRQYNSNKHWFEGKHKSPKFVLKRQMSGKTNIYMVFPEKPWSP